MFEREIRGARRIGFRIANPLMEFDPRGSRLLSMSLTVFVKSRYFATRTSAVSHSNTKTLAQCSEITRTYGTMHVQRLFYVF